MITIASRSRRFKRLANLAARSFFEKREFERTIQFRSDASLDEFAYIYKREVLVQLNVKCEIGVERGARREEKRERRENE